MKNFKQFEKAYEASIKAQAAISTVPYWCISEQGENTFRQARLETIKEIVAMRAILKEWLKKNFPSTAADAYHSDQFSFKHFFEMLKKYPELAEENKEALNSLLSNLKAVSRVPTGLTEIPNISEFVK